MSTMETTASIPSNSSWQQAWDNAQPRLQAWSDSFRSAPAGIKPRVVRVGQLDAELLDEELVQVLQEPLNKAFSLLSQSHRARWEPELTLIIRLTLYKFSLWDIGASYGAKLQDLRYHVWSTSEKMLSPSGIPRSTLAAHAALTVLIPYLHSRLRSHALSHAWPDTPSADRRRKAWNLLSRVESTHALAALASFIVFLCNGRYRSLADRVLSMRMVPSRRLTNREVSYEFMNRQMVWHAFTEFLLFILPLVNARTVRRNINRLNLRIRSLNWSSFFLTPRSPTCASNKPVQKSGKYFSLPPEQCAICAENASFNLSSLSKNASVFTLTPDITTSAVAAEIHSAMDEAPLHGVTTPYQTSCGHTYCYYCISERVIRAVDDGEDGWECLRCAEVIRSCERWTVKADPEERKTSEGWDSDNDDLTSFSSGMSLGSEPERSD